MTDQDQSREAFEAYALRNWCNPDDLVRGRLTGYRCKELNQYWIGWQAATDHKAADVVLPEPVAWMLGCQTMGGDVGWKLSFSQSGAGVCHRLNGEQFEQPLHTEQQVRALLAGVKDSLTTTGVPNATTGADCVTTGVVPAVPQGWKPIESAPRDGALILVMGNNYGDSELGQHHCIASWHRGCWMESSDWNATSELVHLTHWMPLPQPPKEQT